MWLMDLMTPVPSSSRNLDSPKSASLATVVSVSKMFLLFMSQWMMHELLPLCR